MYTDCIGFAEHKKVKRPLDKGQQSFRYTNYTGVIYDNTVIIAFIFLYVKFVRKDN